MNIALCEAIAKIVWPMVKPIVIHLGKDLRDKFAADIAAAQQKKANTPQ